MRVQLDTGVPVFSAVLTPHHFHEHGVHQQFFREHFVVKGTEAAQACLAALASLSELAPRAA
jgi:6,7-dimethyl-8-ribityllumazine synthase